VPEVVPVVTAPQPNANIEFLARDNNLSIASIAREANQSKLSDDQGEVVISLR
jgi:hypothetical protein